MTTVPFKVNDAENRSKFLSHFLPDAIEALKEDTVPMWGQMTAQHMVEHLLWAFELSTGKEGVTCETPARLRKAMRAWLYDDRPNPRNVKNPKLPDTPLPLRYGNIAEAKAAFRKELDHFIKVRETDPDAMNAHPLFGTLGTDEWERVHFKHSYHHLLQFRLVREL